MTDHGPFESIERRLEELTRRVDRLEKRLAGQRPGGGSGGGGAQVTCSVCGSKVSRGSNCAKCGIYVG